MADSNAAKPSKPHPDFPLFPHATKRWAKKIRGKLHYFGPWSDPQAALEKWLEQKDDLLAGRQPRVSAGVTVRDLCNHFLTDRRQAVTLGKMQERSWAEYKDACDRIIEAFGKTRAIDDLRPTDFADLWARLAVKQDGTPRGVESLGSLIQRCRSVFKYAFDLQLIDRPVAFGPKFKRPSKAEWRKEKQAKVKDNGSRMLSPDEIRAVLKIASLPMKAMILLGTNCGLGNEDCAGLHKSHLDLDAGIIDYPRTKTSIERRAVLWPETVKAIREALAVRPKPEDPEDDGLVFLTKYGSRWVRFGKGGAINAVAGEFNKLLTEANIKRAGVSFYGLRRAFETAAGGTLDQATVNRIMGHEDGEMGTRYRQWNRDAAELARLRAVADHVHAWLFGERGNNSQAPSKRGRKSLGGSGRER